MCTNSSPAFQLLVVVDWHPVRDLNDLGMDDILNLGAVARHNFENQLIEVRAPQDVDMVGCETQSAHLPNA